MYFSFNKLKMANRCFSYFTKQSFPVTATFRAHRRLLHATPTLFTVQAGKVKITRNKNRPITYEESLTPQHIGHRKSWNSWNTSTIEGGLRQAETAVEDLFIRKFMEGTFPDALLSKVIIKRQYNIIRIAALIKCKITPQRYCFLIGYTETLLGYWLHCNVKLELQSVPDPLKVVFRYI